ncbi:Uncharacterized protein OBRU01_08811 [Operophtera brumata]|uniref:C2H2-type domain-containing protein n=1 Tax=Operophtera brumata TaxID=104452 RepID=A0A0L7LGN9_OPEBR|nr:Uncharacterized protein OBRU01_08811 [Operophtera brumata]
MWELKACAVCLSTGIRLYSLNTGNLRHEFNSISGLKQKCQRAHYTLEQMLGSNMEIKKTHLKSLNRKQLGIMPSLSLIDLDRTHYETHKFQWITTNSNRRAIASQFDYIPVVHYGTLTKEDTFEDVMTNTIEVEKEHIIKIEDRNEQEDENDNIKAVVVAPVSARIMEPVSTVQGPDINMIDETKSDIEPVDDIESNYMEINNVNDMDYDCDNNDLFGMSCKFEDKDGAKFNEEYAQMVPITVKDAKAAFEHMKGTYHCEICNYYYKTQFLLDCHMTEKHMYKYLFLARLSHDREAHVQVPV